MTILSLNSVNQFIFVIVKFCVCVCVCVFNFFFSFAVRTVFLNVIQTSFGLKGLKELPSYFGLLKSYKFHALRRVTYRGECKLFCAVTTLL
jgi:hypothetical protein